MNQPDDTVEHLLRDEAACDRFEAAWQAGPPPRIEDFVADCSSEERGRLVGKLIELDFHYRREDYKKRFPEWQLDSGLECERYSMVAFHAKGGMGRVSVCHDRELGRRVAMKEMHPEHASNDAALQRFMKEARITGRLEHPNVVPVYDLVKAATGRAPFYTMRFVSGRTLTEAIRAYHEKRRRGEAVGVEMLTLLNAFVSICQTIAYAHTQDVIHRDLKGSNVMLGDFGEVIVLDWGLAKILGEAESVDAGAPSPSSESNDQTQPGVVKGTPAYLSPEGALGQIDRINKLTDVYGLGAILYEILAGQPPYKDPKPPSSLVSDVPTGLEASCLRALAENQEDRHPSAGELAAEVQQWLAESENRSRARKERERFFDLSHDLLATIEPGRDRELFRPLQPGDERTTINLAWEKTFGWTREEMYLLGYMGMCHPEDLEETRAAVKRLMTGEGRPFLVNRYRCKDGSYRWIRWTGSLIPGEQLVYAVGHDITEMKKAEDALRRSQERFELAVRGSGVGIWDWNRETGESWYSPRWKSMIGYEEHEIADTLEEWESRLHPDDREKAFAALRTCTEGGADEFEVEYRFRHKDGSYRWIHDRGVAVRNETGVVRMAGAHTDITERKRSR